MKIDLTGRRNERQKGQRSIRPDASHVDEGLTARDSSERDLDGEIRKSSLDGTWLGRSKVRRFEDPAVGSGKQSLVELEVLVERLRAKGRTEGQSESVDTGKVEARYLEV